MRTARKSSHFRHRRLEPLFFIASKGATTPSPRQRSSEHGRRLAASTSASNETPLYPVCASHHLIVITHSEFAALPECHIHAYEPKRYYIETEDINRSAGTKSLTERQPLLRTTWIKYVLLDVKPGYRGTAGMRLGRATIQTVEASDTGQIDYLKWPERTQQTGNQTPVERGP